MTAIYISGTRGGDLGKARTELIERVSDFCIQKYRLGRFKAFVQIKVARSRKLMDDFAVGYSSMDKVETDSGYIKWGLIELTNQNKKELVKTLIHEWTHIKQYLRGELSYDGRSWQGMDVSDVAYERQACEKEAYKMQEVLYKELVDLKLL